MYSPSPERLTSEHLFLKEKKKKRKERYLAAIKKHQKAQLVLMARVTRGSLEQAGHPARGWEGDPDWLPDQQLLQTLISFYRRDTVGTIALHSCGVFSLKSCPPRGPCATSHPKCRSACLLRFVLQPKAACLPLLRVGTCEASLFCGSWTTAWSHRR